MEQGWVFEFFLKQLARLPLWFLYSFGSFLGKIAYFVLPNRRRIAQINLARAFPDLSRQELRQLVKQNFKSFGMGMIEMILAWYASRERILKLGNITGLEQVEQALKFGKGVILVAPHVLSFELGGRVLSEYLKLAAVYRVQNQGFFNQFLERARGQHYLELIPKTNVRRLIRFLGQNKIVVYLADQAPPKKRRVYIPWFGIPVATHTALSHIVRLSGAVMLPAFMCRVTPGQYKLTIEPPIQNVAQESEERDAMVLNQFMEQRIRLYKDQYFWMHRCFKKLPDEKMNYYAQTSVRPKKFNIHRYERLLLFFEVSSQENVQNGLLYSKGKQYGLRFFDTYQNAKCFILNTNTLRRLGFDTILVARFYVVPEKNKYFMIYRTIQGQSVFDLMQTEDWIESFQTRFTQFMIRLHRQGVYSDTIHPKNIILQPNQFFALSDIPRVAL